ncbi:hypothetical protein BCD67_14820 [Oscillatoriales cyanobacterium USR001]|nr:hypothetical protein BCD67_14820 [Oscillatoriales cyanobacterium USR001]
MKQFPFPLRFSIPIILLVLGSFLGLFSFKQEISQFDVDAEEEISHDAKFTGTQTAETLEYLYRKGDIEQAEIIISKSQGDINIKLALLCDENNQVLLATRYELRQQPVSNTLDVNILAALEKSRQTMAYQAIISQDKQTLWAIHPVLLGAIPGELRPSRVGTLLLKYDITAIKQRTYNNALQRSIKMIIGLALVCVILWFFFDKTITQRAARLVATSKSLTVGELGTRASLQGSDELAQIATAFNKMAAWIQSNTEELHHALEVKEALAIAAFSQTQNLEKTLQELRKTQAQLIQTEKMSSLGQMVAGVAHEINNPVNFIHGNLTHVTEYINNLLHLINLYQQRYPDDAVMQEHLEDIDLEFLSQDLPKILSSMKIGTNRIREIVLTLRNFSRLDEADMKPVNIHEGIDSTLLILNDRLKAKGEHLAINVIKEYANLPKIECYAGQLNQVFMNILSNAIDALHEYDRERKLKQSSLALMGSNPQDKEVLLKINQPNNITIKTQVFNSDWVTISIHNNRSEISHDTIDKLFDPFFTTKPVGQGTGLGLSISYQIVVDKHHGSLTCISEPDQGVEFLIKIPIKQSSKQIKQG